MPNDTETAATNASLIDGFVDGYSIGKAGEECVPPDHFTPAARQERITNG